MKTIIIILFIAGLVACNEEEIKPQVAAEIQARTVVTLGHVNKRCDPAVYANLIYTKKQLQSVLEVTKAFPGLVPPATIQSWRVQLQGIDVRLLMCEI